MRKIAVLLLIFVSFHMAEKICHKLTSGFSILRVQPNTAFDPALENLSQSLEGLDQQFSYLGFGNQCFVFASEDGKYILKLFKNGRVFTPSWAGKIPLINKFKPFRPNRIAKAAKKRSRDFLGYKIAYDEFREETGLLCIHLNATESGFPTIPLCDKLKIEHQLDLNKACFVLQKRADPVLPKLKAWLKEGKTDKIEHTLAALMRLCRERAKKGISDDDAQLQTNFGLLDERPIQTDPGRYCHQDELKDPSLQQKDIDRIQSRFIRYLNKTSPELIPYVVAASNNL